MREVLEGCDAIVNFAAESHVDRSIEEPGHFIQTDVYGTYVLLEEARARRHRALRPGLDRRGLRLDRGGLVHRAEPARPVLPLLGLQGRRGPARGGVLPHVRDNATICRASNNYGPYQYPEKLIPLCVLNALHGDPLPVYGDGMQVRNWLHVDDHCRGIDVVLREGKPGEVYNIGGPDELPNIEVVRKILELTGRDESLIEHVTDRPGHDRRYSLAWEKTAALGWRPRSGLRRESRRRSSGTRTTPGGGSRSAPATTASTTSVSTARNSSRERPLPAPGDPARRGRPDRAAGDRRRPRLLLRDLPCERVCRARRRRRLRPGQPLAVGPRHGASAPLPARAGPGQAGAGCARRGLGRGRRPAPGLARRTASTRPSSCPTRTRARSSSRSGSRTASA